MNEHESTQLEKFIWDGLTIRDKVFYGLCLYVYDIDRTEALRRLLPYAKNQSNNRYPRIVFTDDFQVEKVEDRVHDSLQAYDPHEWVQHMDSKVRRLVSILHKVKTLRELKK